MRYWYGQLSGMLDLLIKEAKVVDGTGARAWIGDVAIKNGRFVSLERHIDAEAHRVISARECILAPGFIDTDMFRAIPQKQKAPILERVSLGRIGEPSDVSNLVLFLASERAKYITGQVIVVDGGMI